MNETCLFGLGDGDRVQSMIDHALLEGDLDSVRRLSGSLTSAMMRVSDLVREIGGWQVVFSGGDDICLMVERSAYRDDIIEGLMRRFYELTGATMSFGVGASIEDAYINLRRAKSRGRGTLVSDIT